MEDKFRMPEIDAVITIKGPQRTYVAEVVSLTRPNKDGGNRQEILKRCRKGERVRLVRETDAPDDPDGVAVFRENGEQLGYVEPYRAPWWHIYRNGEIAASILALGSPDHLRSFNKSHQRQTPDEQERIEFGCLLQITEGGFGKDYLPFWDKNREIENLLRSGQEKERESPEEAVAIYRMVTEGIIKLDSTSPLAKAWRMVRFPVNRLSLLLDKMGRAEEALQAIESYEKYDDRPVGISTGEREAITKRKERLLVKLGRAKAAPRAAKKPAPKVEVEMVQHFREEVRGITKQNRDRTSRQKIIREDITTMSLLLLTPDEGSDESPIKVTTREGKQVGYLLTSIAKDIIKLKAKGYRHAAFVDEILEWEPYEGHTHYGISALILEVAPETPDSKIVQYVHENFAHRGIRIEKLLLEPFGLKPAEAAQSASATSPERLAFNTGVSQPASPHQAPSAYSGEVGHPIQGCWPPPGAKRRWGVFIIT